MQLGVETVAREAGKPFGAFLVEQGHLGVHLSAERCPILYTAFSKFGMSF